MSLLNEGIANGTVQETELTVRHTIDGVTSTYPVYHIRADQLFYNNQNDRIATWVSKYRADHDGEDPISLGREEYNAIIEQFIVDSNPSATKQTQGNIKAFGQRVPGVVLNDGRVIDGNRRLTCIRRIARDTSDPGWFDAAILSDEIASEPKRIKMLELSIQHGEEGKVDYDPIERLVGVYNDIIKDRLLTIPEYAKSTYLQEGEVKKLVEQAQLMKEFLEFANAGESYHLARELEIAGPLGEMGAILRKARTERDKLLIKQSLFANILIQPEGDITRFVRKFKKILGSNAADNFLQEEIDLASTLVDRMGGETMNRARVAALRADTALSGQFRRAVEKANETARVERLLDVPLKKTAEAIDCLDQVLPDMLDKLTDAELRGVRDNLDEIIQRSKQLIIKIVERA